MFKFKTHSSFMPNFKMFRAGLQMRSTTFKSPCLQSVWNMKTSNDNSHIVRKKRKSSALYNLKVVDLICKPALNILKVGMNEECTILMTCMNSQSCRL